MKPGDEVICIYKGGFNLKYNAEYIINYSMVCSCGKNLVTVGIASPNYCTDYTRCNCGNEHKDPNGQWWFDSKHFVKKEDMKQAEYMVEELKEELEVTV